MWTLCVHYERSLCLKIVRGVPHRQIAPTSKKQRLIVAHKMTECKEFYSWRLTEVKSNQRQDTLTQKLTPICCGVNRNYRVQSQASPCVLSVEKSGVGKEFSPSTSDLCSQYHSAFAQGTIFRPSPTLYNISI